MLGLERGRVALYDHELSWEAEAEKTISKMKSVLGGVIKDIQHIGSTSIPTIKAKPIIDIAVAVDDFDDILKYEQELRSLGFYYRPDMLDSQLLFACGSFYEGTGNLQTHFIHIVKAGSMEWINYINFRNYLIKKPEIAKEYEALKLELAASAPVDSGREKYLAGKHSFIVFTLRKALVDSYLGKTVKIYIDRPVGYVHKKEKYSLTYNINYGYIPGVLGGDGEELDVYLLGVTEPVKEYDVHIIGIVHRHNDVEDKLVAAPCGVSFDKEYIEKAVDFQEKYYDTEIELAEN